jgi:hypothetical protein
VEAVNEEQLLAAKVASFAKTTTKEAVRAPYMEVLAAGYGCFLNRRATSTRRVEIVSNI